MNQHFENVDMEVPCFNCAVPGYANGLDSAVADVRPSTFIPGENGLLATRDVRAGTFVASFGSMKEVSKGARGRLGYSIPCRQVGSSHTRCLAPVKGYRNNGPHKAHACNHTCKYDAVNAEYKVVWEDGQKPEVYVKTSRDVLSGEEFFVDYGPDFALGACYCHIHGGQQVSAGL